MTVGTQVDEMAIRNALRQSHDGFFMIDQDRRVIMFSEGCERITGHDAASVVGASISGDESVPVPGPDNHARSLAGELCPARQIFTDAIRDTKQRMSMLRPDGRRVWVETGLSPMKDAQGGVACVVGIMREVSEGAAAGGGAMVDAQTSGSSGESLDVMLATLERSKILEALRLADGQRTLAAKQLGISRSRLYRRMEALGIDPRNVSGQPE